MPRVTKSLRRESGEVRLRRYEPECGVPQGSLNGPLFFSLFINDALSVLNHCKYHLYADDFTIYCCSPLAEARETIERMNSDLSHLATWAAANGIMVITTHKTFSIWFGSPYFIRQLQALNLPSPRINDTPIYCCDSIKILGVM